MNETAHLIVTTNASMAHYLHSEATALTAALRSPMAGGEAWYSGLLLASASDAVRHRLRLSHAGPCRTVSDRIGPDHRHR